MANRSEVSVSETSSLVSSTSVLDISIEKYQRLASQYAKIRSEFSVLKKAFVEEQEKTEEQNKVIKSQELNVRRLEQEIESLMFRNQQLIKRIGVLQQELDSKIPSTKSIRSFLSPRKESTTSRDSDDSIRNQSISNATIDSELIEELNSRLKSKYEEYENMQQKFQNSERLFIDQIEHLEQQLSIDKAEHQKEIEIKTEELSEMASSLKMKNDENVDLEIQLAQLNKAFCDIKFDFENLKMTNSNLNKRLSDYEREAFPSANRESTVFNSDSRKLFSLSQINNNEFSRNMSVRENVIKEFLTKFSALICAISTLHLNVYQKISIMYALFKKNYNHLYFLDYDSSNTLTLPFFDEKNQSHNTDSRVRLSTTNEPRDLIDAKSISDDSEAKENHFSNMDSRSANVLNILQKFRDYMNLGHDTYLVQIEDAIKQFAELKIRQMNVENKSKDCDLTCHLKQIEGERAQISMEISETITDYIGFLNRLNVYITVCLNMWCQKLRDYDCNNPIIRKNLDSKLQSRLMDNEQRKSLCEKNELLILSITDCIRIVGKICNHIQLLLSKSFSKTNVLTLFKKFISSMETLERIIEETKRGFSSKVALEHDLGITFDSDLKSSDDSILSSLVFVFRCLQEIRLFFLQNYYHFIDTKSIPSVSEQESISNDDNILNETEESIYDESIDSDHKTFENKQVQRKQMQKLISNDENESPNLETDRDINRSENDNENSSKNLKMSSFESEQKCDIDLRGKSSKISLNKFQQSTYSNDSSNSNNLNEMEKKKSQNTKSLSRRDFDQEEDENNCVYFAELGSIQSMMRIFPRSSEIISIQNGESLEEKLKLQNSIIIKLYDDLQSIDSMANAFKNELEIVSERLLRESEKNISLNEKIAQLERTTEELREEHQTLTNSYENQLQAMSEHLISLNEKFLMQKDEIEAYRNDRTNVVGSPESNQKKRTTNNQKRKSDSKAIVKS
ncbi:Protein phosphatase 1 regulatory subunit 21 [Sarcoptes scabiei]|uniref:Protein phosphatase 1 regulatory subunit 21 n=1 Tax=Sarcoptes scabiei TaxID=52283 RepID=A0A834RKA0_SARSC|nr:Protein phosphatase 1 regulatory subunit 21 [Sarcoptes scabiei]